MLAKWLRVMLFTGATTLASLAFHVARRFAFQLNGTSMPFAVMYVCAFAAWAADVLGQWQNSVWGNKGPEAAKLL